jgi:prepilin-type N-terminal cleavage/methylation domain-containing protein
LKRGFSLLEVVIALTLLAIGAAILIPAMAAVNSRVRAVAARDELDLILARIPFMMGIVQRHPKFISQLQIPLVSGDSTNCGSIYPAPGVWNGQSRNYGPFYRSRMVVTPGSNKAFILANGFGAVNDRLVRPLSVTEHMYIEINDVAEPDAVALKFVRAGTGGDSVTWSAPVEGVVTVQYWRNSPC